jgi:hypothetical protein
MAEPIKISALTVNSSPAATDVAAVSNAASTATNKVTLQSIARLFSDPTGITGADAITNAVSLTQAEYDALGSTSNTTLYIVTE